MPGHSIEPMSAKDFMTAVENGAVTDKDGNPVGSDHPVVAQISQASSQAPSPQTRNWKNLFGLLPR